ncbi:MAG: hypothetical protein J7521_10575 [Caulobacter sp.]|nr:hypothetical protein [Caulobacter sp.]
MTRPHIRLTILGLAAAGLLAACGPGQGKNATTVVLTGPPDKVQALMKQHDLLKAQPKIEALEDGGQRATLDLPKGLPLGEIVQLGKDAAAAGVSYEFTSGTRWSSGGEGDPPEAARRIKGPVA